MSRNINPLKILELKKALKTGMSVKRAALQAGIPKSSANNATQLKSVKKCLDELAQEFKLSDITVDNVLSELNTIKLMAIQDKDFSTAARCKELIGKYLAMFTDKQQVDSNVKFTDEELKDVGRLRSNFVSGIDNASKN